MESISVTNLTKQFGKFTAVNAINFEIRQGEIFGFLGPNGSGKSTTIRMLCGIIESTSGEGYVGGYNINTESEKVKSVIGYMSQKFSLYEDLSVSQNIDFYSGIYGIPKEKKQEKKDWILEMAGLKGKERSTPKELSGGWRQRLALGCAVIHQPKIIFLDEPTAGVDPISRRNFWDLIQDLSQQGITIFVTTHYMDEAEHCNRLAFIYNGDLISTGTPRELKTGMHSLEEVFVNLIKKHDK
ncbi:MAG: ABC transporter ATP-binding protein [Elusimicrobia bacterium]|nr:ABC transporter ATP-binding protein [Elusimicrobiota bacterium]MBU2614227.1 ABC transporter ATP-binding protein [Elusimicrobiota bacterium]